MKAVVKGLVLSCYKAYQSWLSERGLTERLKTIDFWGRGDRVIAWLLWRPMAGFESLRSRLLVVVTPG